MKTIIHKMPSYDPDRPSVAPSADITVNVSSKGLVHRAYAMDTGAFYPYYLNEGDNRRTPVVRLLCDDILMVEEAVRTGNQVNCIKCMGS